MVRFALIAGCFTATLLAVPAAAQDAQPAPAAEKPADNSQEMVCRREKETGSLVKSRKTCHTRAQWRYIDDVSQQFSRQLVDDARTKSTSN